MVKKETMLQTLGRSIAIAVLLASPAFGEGVTTRSYDLARTGVNDHETSLTADAVRSKGITKQFELAIPDDPRLDAQPLAVADVNVKGRTRDIIIQASMGNTVYAFDAATGEKLWTHSLGKPIVGSRKIDAWFVNVNWGILSTPTIDVDAGLVYVCAWISVDGTPEKGQHFVAALKLNDGSLPKQMLSLEGATYEPAGLPRQKFSSAMRKQRAALSLSQGKLYIPFGSIFESSESNRGWLIAVDTQEWRIVNTWTSAADGAGGGIWQSGSGPAFDEQGNVYVVTGNGDFDPTKGNFGEAVVKLSPDLKVTGWWSPFSDNARSGLTGKTTSEAPLPSNVTAPMLVGHAKRMGIEHPEKINTDGADAGAPEPDDAMMAEQVKILLPKVNGVWADQDLGAGGAVYAAATRELLVAGKDGILYSVNADNLGNTAPSDLTNAAATKTNYAKLKFPPILYTYYDPSMPPQPDSPTVLNKLPGGATRHEHGTPLLWHSSKGWLHYVGGENSALRAWLLNPDGSSTYLAGADEVASSLSPKPPGGMPGWSITLAANQGDSGIIVASIPLKDSNMSLSPGRMLVYDAQNFSNNVDGSKRLQLLWDSSRWGPEHNYTHPKFNRPIVFKGRIYLPTYDGKIMVYGLNK